MSTKIAPKCQLRLEWVFGYRGHQCRNNLHYVASNEIVFFVAGVAVVYNTRQHKQRFFLGHDDDIISQAVHPERVLVATGQVGREPQICVWHSLNMQTVSILKGGHKHGVAALAFDRQGNRIVSVGLHQQAAINIWDWAKGKILATTRAHSDRVFDVQFDRYDDTAVVSCGVKHIKFWALCGNALTAKKGVFGKTGDIQTMLCVAFAPDNVTFAGTLSGDIYVWKGSNLQSVVAKAHQGSVHSIHWCDEGYTTGGKDGLVRLWDNNFNPISKIDFTQLPDGYPSLCVRSVCWHGDQLLVGTQDGEVFEMTVGGQNKTQCVVQGHSEGELWALAVHPRKPIFATASDDHTVRLWNMMSSRLLSRTTLDQAARSCAFNVDGSQLAVGLTDGSFMVLMTKDLQEVVHIHDRKEVLHEMKFSPDGNFLAVGSNDNFVDIYAVSQQFKKVGQCSGNSSFVTHLDWSEDSKYLQTNSGAAERLFFKMPGGKQATSRDELRTIQWSTWTGVLGPQVNGIWEKYTDTNDINAADANLAGDVIVTGDDFGLVKMFRFPSPQKGAKFRKYTGHSAHVTNCRFSADKQRVITVGGADHAVFQWRFLPEGMIDKEDTLHDENACVDSDSEASDSDLSDVGEVDSDVEAERQKDYSRCVYKEDMGVLKRQMRADLQAGERRAQPPDDALQLQFVHGYRGYDCRNNLFYLQSSEVVYHVAAAAIVYHRERHSQRFYLQHTDDILCLCLHTLKDIVATGQVGRDPTIHVWDAESMKTLSILKGNHQRGVCAVDFSGDGKRLASVGLDDNHSIVVWDWRKGEKLATTRGHKDKVFVIKWNPYEMHKMVTVGVKHIKFWTQAGGGFTSHRGTFGSVAKLDSMMCVAYGKAPEICYTGGSSGAIYIWIGVELSKTVKAHEGPCFAMHSLDKGFVTGGKDGVVSLWDDQFERSLKTYPLRSGALAPATRGMLLHDCPPIRAVVLGHGHILIGTKNGEVLEMSKEGTMNILVQGHREGELWGLAVHPSKATCATVSDDKSLCVWDISSQHRMLNCKLLKKPARCVCFSPDGKALAIGFRDGSFTVVNTDTLDDIVQFHHRKQDISDIRFSPGAGKYLAVASHDNVIDIYNVMSSKRVGVCKGHSSYLTHIDWDKRGKLLVSNSGAREQLFFEAPRGKRQTLRSADVEKHEWDSWTGVLGASCDGIWPPKCDVTDVNASCLTTSRTLLATGDDFGFVKLFRYPAKGKYSKFKKYLGHSAHVTNVRWASDDSQLLSVGGADTALMVWSRLTAGERKCERGESDDSDTESEEEGGYDSDVAAEKDIDYTSKIYTDPIRKTSGDKPHEQQYDDVDRPQVSRQAHPAPKVQKSTPPAGGNKKKRLVKVNDLELETVFGYRGFDCRSNVHYLNDGADIVYHAAGTCIVMNLAAGTQRFYREHADDIISLTTNEHPKFVGVVASGEIGTQPAVHVWEAGSGQTVSILRDVHRHGVCALDFSCSGRLLLSVAVDGAHTIAVHRWQQGTLVASAPGHTQRIFAAKFRPDSDNHFVTAGVRHVTFWTVTGMTLVGRRAVLAAVPDQPDGRPAMQTMLALAFGANGVTFSGAMSGDVYVWKDTTLARVVSKAHNGPIFSMFTTLRDGLIVTGAKEPKSREGGSVKLWDQEMKRCRAFQLNTGQTVNVVKSVSRYKGKMVVGTKAGELLEICEKTGEVRELGLGHGEGELWGLATHPSADKFISASDDGTVRMWDIGSKRMLHKLVTGPARSADISPNGELIGVGLKNGGFVLINMSGFTLWGQKRDRATAINVIRFSPSGQCVAVGSHDGFVDFYDVSKGPSLQRVAYCKGISSFVTMLDFSSDSKYIKVITGSYTSHIFEVSAAREVTDKQICSNIIWATWTSVLGSDVVGIWPRVNPSADVNCADVSRAGNSIVSGDDFGLIKLFDFPCPQANMAHKSYAGHSAHVTNVRFTFNDRYVVSAGGDDCCIFVWKSK